jgi:hypothetical protein
MGPKDNISVLEGRVTNEVSEGYIEIDRPEAVINTSANVIMRIEHYLKKDELLGSYFFQNEFINSSRTLFSEESRCYCKKNRLDSEDTSLFVVRDYRHDEGVKLVCEIKVGEGSVVTGINYGTIEGMNLSRINYLFKMKRNLELEEEEWKVEKWYRTGTALLNAPLETGWFIWRRKS